MTTGISSASLSIPAISTAQVRAALLAREEIALLDVREEAPHAQSHPLFAANFPFSHLELNAWTRIPRRDTRIVTLDDGEGLAVRAAQRLRALGYTDVHVLQGGVSGWREAGGELFQDVNVPSKAFGELVESQHHTPSLSAQEVKALLDAQEDVVVVDARRFDEYQNMNIPGSISVPGAELVLRVRALAPDPATRVIVNCAGRTRSIIGTQSLVNAGIANPVHALRNGTIGWTLAGQALEHGQQRRFPEAVDEALVRQAREQARAVADRAGVGRIDAGRLAELETPGRTVYRFDVRTPEQYRAGHLPGFLSAPGGQLVQETEMNAPVRGARIVLADDDGVRANMTASWLAQMAWEVYVADGFAAADFAVAGEAPRPVPESGVSPQQRIAPAQLKAWLEQDRDTVLLDVSLSARYVARHIPGAWFVLRSQIEAVARNFPSASRYVLTCGTSLLAQFAVADLQALVAQPVYLLEGGNAAWERAGFGFAAGEETLLSARIDRYRRPYEGTDNAASAMQAYLDWEFGLVEQLGRDGTHGFFVI
ncbi:MULTISPECIES: rhodanese-related sulfurtransferase [unclassified Herbaspirillum]|uniref:rhodanese-related sulfurtransferase n=1 Tax=unclassified Herbaspirillum TaxID=2624150 RepID=UPI00114FDEB6|nr:MULTISPECIES: rhodanese-related sulfurtransferase [unclassified Herbaspirillum]MBB5391521.1 rhodanese-related sulfurtransferase [Herbaspirillum sp. SJZ102]TQK12796.1 3-mercaptopyruvate sulfurtransferase SseA [Herbaspirillum sp. SJZ130]TQK14800.1 3-mercaptopyruvate sulfurtransferase SseA [Herbaspirillum sp. SJZ106]